MLSVRDEASLSRALELPIDDRLKHLLHERRTQLGYDFDLTELAHFLIVQPNDHLSTIEQALGFSILVNQVDGSRFGEADFSPSFEWIADHGFCFEAVFIFEDSGFGHVLLVPKLPAVNAKLIAFCTHFASARP
jgi:hypothetical protein